MFSLWEKVVFNELPPAYAVLRDDLMDVGLHGRPYLEFFVRPPSPTGRVYKGYWRFHQ